MEYKITRSVAFFGPAGAGKTTLADGLARFYSAPVLSFAAPIKIQYALDKNININLLRNPNTKNKYRLDLQRYGDELRAANPSFLVDKLLADFDRQYGFGTRIFFVDDVRLPDEYQVLKDRGFLMVRVEGNKSTLTAEQQAHGTEAHWMKFVADFEVPWIAPLTNSYWHKQLSIYRRMALLYKWLDPAVAHNMEQESRKHDK